MLSQVGRRDGERKGGKGGGERLVDEALVVPLSIALFSWRFDEGAGRARAREQVFLDTCLCITRVKLVQLISTLPGEVSGGRSWRGVCMMSSSAFCGVTLVVVEYPG